MALQSDDCDIRPAWFNVELGGNGDYYLTTVEEQELPGQDQALRVLTSVRVSTSGGNAPTDVKLAVAELYRALERHGLNQHPIHQLNDQDSREPT